MDNRAFFNIGYGLYILGAEDNGKDNGCIVNAVMQVTNTPNRLAFAVSKQNYTCEMIAKTNRYSISVLSEDATFDLFRRFGFQSGRDTDKFDGFGDVKRTKNGVYYITHATNAFFSGSVINTADLGTHLLFTVDVEEAEVLSSAPTATYTYYQEHIKPKPEASKKKGWRCKICGYEYEGEVLPPDFICPLCKHPASDFEKM